MNRAIVTHVRKREPHFGRRAQDAGVKPVGEHLSRAAHDGIQAPGNPDAETLHALRETLLVVGFDHHVQVIPLHREFADAHAETLAPRHECMPDRVKGPWAAQATDMGDNAEGDVDGESTREDRTRRVTHAGALALRLATRSLTPAAPAGREEERQLSGPPARVPVSMRPCAIR